MTIWIIIGIVVILILWGISLYNSLVKAKIKVDNSWSDIRVFLKKRFDLIPNIVNTVKGYATHERDTFEEITKARTAVAQAPDDDVQAQSTANVQLTGALGRLFAVAENYPDLKANENFLELQNALTGMEGDLGNARRFYNATVRDYNTAIQQFPGLLFARSMGFSSRKFFELEDPQEAGNVKVKF